LSSIYGPAKDSDISASISKLRHPEGPSLRTYLGVLLSSFQSKRASRLLAPRAVSRRRGAASYSPPRCCQRFFFVAVVSLRFRTVSRRRRGRVVLASAGESTKNLSGGRRIFGGCLLL